MKSTSNRKKTLRFFVIPMLVIFSITQSCKTIQVQEKWAFAPSEYSKDQLVQQNENSNASLIEKALSLKAIEAILDTDNEFIIEKNSVTLNRYFYPINDSIKVEYFVFQPKNTNKTGLFYMGNSSNIFDFSDNLFELASKTNSQIYVINYRGYGRTKGIPSFLTQFSDNSIIVNEVIQKQRKIDYVIGFSLGTVFASYSASELKTDALYLLAPFSNTKDLFKYFKRQNTKGIKALFRPFLKFSAEEYLLNVSNTAKIKSYTGKFIIFHGNNDKQLPYFMGQSLYKNSISKNKALITIEGGNHWSPMLPENWNLLIEKIK